MIRSMKGGPSKTKKKNQKKDDSLYESENTSTLQCQKPSFCICPVHILHFSKAFATDICQGEGKEVITSSWMSKFFWTCLPGNTWVEEAEQQAPCHRWCKTCLLTLLEAHTRGLIRPLSDVRIWHTLLVSCSMAVRLELQQNKINSYYPPTRHYLLPTLFGQIFLPTLTALRAVVATKLIWLNGINLIHHVWTISSFWG